MPSVHFCIFDNNLDKKITTILTFLFCKVDSVDNVNTIDKVHNVENVNTVLSVGDTFWHY